MMLSTYKCIVSFTLFFYFVCFCPEFTQGGIKHGDVVRDEQGDVLFSDGFNFVMGFFGFDNSSSRYVGIWYYNIPGPQIIWVANRNTPINGNGGSFTIAENGNLVILDENKNQIWSTNVSIGQNNTNNNEAVLRDDGNLVLANENAVLWESFENPCDTYVPGMKVPVNGKSFFFTSWKSRTDPSLGNHTLGVDPKGLPPQVIVWEGERKIWRSGYWDGRIFTGVDMTGSFLHGFVLNYDNNGDRYFVYNDNEWKLNGSSVRFQIGWDGYERELVWNENEKRWIEIQKGPHNECELYNYCGSFAACELSVLGLAICSCLQGFELRDEGNLSGGCTRMTALKGDQSNGSFGEDGFLELTYMKLPDFARVVNTKDCEGNCLENGSCTAYAEVIGIGCMLWYGDLVDVQQFERGDGNSLHIRLAHSDLGKVLQRVPLALIPCIWIFNFNYHISPVLFFHVWFLSNIILSIDNTFFFIVSEDDESQIFTSFYDGCALMICIISMHPNTGHGGKNNKIMIVIILTVMAGLICLGILVLLVLRYKTKLKGEILIHYHKAYFFSY